MTPEPSAYVQQAEATEQQLIERAAQAVSVSNWVIGECASQWTEMYSQGRTDADFAELIGVSRKRVNESRLVYERLGGWRDAPTLTFFHLRTALPWDDADVCLEWAHEMQATVAEMKAWRRAQRGEDLNEPAEQERENPERDEEPERVAGRAPQRAKGNSGKTNSGGGKGKARSATARKADTAEPDPLFAPPCSTDATPEAPDEPLTASEAILSIRKVLRKVETDVDPEGREEVLDELKSWLKKLDPPKQKKLEWRPENAEIPEALDTPEFRAKWVEWCEFRRKRKPAISKMAATKQLNVLSKHPIEIAIEALDRSILNDYQGVFPDRVPQKTDRMSAGERRLANNKNVLDKIFGPEDDE